MRNLLLVSSLSVAAAVLAPVANAGELPTGRPNKEDMLYQQNSQFIVSLGMQNGGDEIIALFDSTTGEQSDSTRAGGYFRFVLGGDIAIPQTPFSVEISAGILRDALTSNVNADKALFRRKVIELIPFWNFDRHRVGIGAVAHLDPVFSVNLEGPGLGSFELDDAVGAVVQYDIRYDQNLSVGARYTVISYDSSVAGSMPQDSYNGNALGLHVTVSF